MKVQKEYVTAAMPGADAYNVAVIAAVASESRMAMGMLPR